MNMDILEFERDRFGGVVIDGKSLPGREEFPGILEKTLGVLKEEGVKLAWLFLPLERSDLVEASTAAGFSYHHADGNGLQLTLPLVEGSFIPGYATHYVGAGGVLLDEENRILVIQEKFHTRKHYKLPGGALDPGEHIADAVVREIREETGIESEFLSLHSFRHWHGYRYGKSDIYFVCRLKPLSHKITLDPSEISEALWMPMEEYLNHPDTHPFNRKIVLSTINKPGLILDDIEDYGSPETHEMFFSR